MTPLKEARCVMECTSCGRRSIWRTNNRVIYPDHTLWCPVCGYQLHKRVHVGRWHEV
jgi:predicted RNA-binding Zn-ribbon protein involved in translation (DUF1610 family)